MQEEEKSASVAPLDPQSEELPTEEAKSSTPPTSSAVESQAEAEAVTTEKIQALRTNLSRIAQEEEAQAAEEDTGDGTEKKIETLRTNLFRIAQAEEAQAVSLRVASQIRQVKERKEHPELFPPQPPRSSPMLQLVPVCETPPPPPEKPSAKGRLRGLFPQKGDSGGEVVRKCIFLGSAAVFLVCLVLIILYVVDIYRADSLYEDLGSSYHARLPETEAETTVASTDETQAPTEKHYTLLDSAADLLAINEETVGWISIPDTKVDYPLMQHLDDTPGEEYYLYRNMQKEDSKPGSIFLDYRCSFDRVGEDGTLSVANSDNLIIYGHNMRDTSMFGTLKYYKTDENYYEEHPIIELNSNYETYQYKIFGYFIADAEDTTDTRFEYWNAINFADETEFYEYVNEVKRRTLRLTNVDVEYGDSLLTLSTCNNAFDTARLVIVARRVRDGEDPYDRVVGSTPNPNIKWPSVYYLWHDDTYDPDAAFAPYG